MTTKATSRDVRDRLSFGPHSVSVGSLFLETVRAALRDARGGTRRHRVLYQEDNCAVATERLVIELLACGTPVDGIHRVRDAYQRAFNELLSRLNPPPRLVLERVIGDETLVNGRQNMDAHEVLTDGSLSDLERLYESTRQQRDVSEQVMLACSERIRQLRRTA